MTAQALTVSVVIPCYNVEAYISQCVASVLAQTYTAVELICVDNNSTDNTFAALQRLQENHPGMVLLSEPVKGAPAARNTGWVAARGTYIQFLDADDLLMPEKIMHQVYLIQSAGFPDIVAGSYAKHYLSGNTVQVFPDKESWAGLVRGKLGITSANLWKKSALEQAGGWSDTGSSQEYELMFRILKQGGRVEPDKEVNTVIRERSSGSISKTNVRDNWRRFVELRQEMLHYLSTNTVSAQAITAAENALFDAVRVLYSYDKEAALKKHREIFPKNYMPKITGATTATYIVVYRLLGFKLVQYIKSFFSGKA